MRTGRLLTVVEGAVLMGGVPFLGRGGFHPEGECHPWGVPSLGGWLFLRGAVGAILRGVMMSVSVVDSTTPQVAPLQDGTPKGRHPCEQNY